MIEIRSSWTVDARGVRPLGEPSRKMGAESPQRQRIRDRIARYGTANAQVAAKRAAR